MVLFVIGLGLGDEKDITVRGLEYVQSCEMLFLEHYTSILPGVDVKRLEQFYGKTITLADRDMVENQAESIYERAKVSNVGFLVVGDPLCATTHTDLILRARSLGIKVEVVHNTSVMGAVASCGLQLYKYGFTVSIPFFDGSWRPDSFYDRIKYNNNGEMHSLCLLDIKVKEPDYNALHSGGRLKYLPPRFMTVNCAIDQLLEVEEKRKEGVISPDSLGVGMARLGQASQKIVFGKLSELMLVDYGAPLHCLALCSEIHPLELELLQEFQVRPEDMVLTLADVAKHHIDYMADPDNDMDNDDDVEDIDDN